MGIRQLSLITLLTVLTAFSENNAESLRIEKRQIINSGFDPNTDTIFYLFTANNKDTPDIVKLNDETSLAASHFNKSNPTRVLIHGWQNNITSPFNVVLRQAYLKKGDFNILSVDWSKIASTLDYVGIRENIPKVANVVATYINYLCENLELPISSFYVIGHSFGAHLSGYVGKITKSSYQKTLPTIYGLDPALPGYYIDDPNIRLNSTDANYVESIQTNCGQFGYVIPVGQAAFYPNAGGPLQPGCNLLDIACSHGRSFEFFAESINSDKFIGHKCDEIGGLLIKTCTKPGPDAIMGGEPSRPGRSGVYYLPTNANSPYAVGQFTQNQSLLELLISLLGL